MDRPGAQTKSLMDITDCVGETTDLLVPPSSEDDAGLRQKYRVEPWTSDVRVDDLAKDRQGARDRLDERSLGQFDRGMLGRPTDEAPLLPRDSILLPGFHQVDSEGKAISPFAHQIYTIWQLAKMEQHLTFVDGNGNLQPVGAVNAHEMGTGKTIVSFVWVLWNICLLAMRRQVDKCRRSGGTDHLAKGVEAGATCPSCRWHGVLRCTCEPDNPINAVKPFAGMHILVLPPQLLLQYTQEFVKFVDVGAFKDEPGIEVAMGGGV